MGLQTDLVEVRLTETQGYGAFAKKNIPQGTIIVYERPIMYVKKDHNMNVLDFCRVYEDSTEEEKRELSKLYYYPEHIYIARKETYKIQTWCRGVRNMPHEEVDKKVTELLESISRWWTNAAGIDAFSSAVYPTFSRFNHSCDPNCKWDIEQGRASMLTVTTMRVISAGEQLCLSYSWRCNDPKNPLSLEERRQYLHNWGFLCNCSRCTAEELNNKSILPAAEPSTEVDDESSEDEQDESSEDDRDWMTQFGEAINALRHSHELASNSAHAKEDNDEWTQLNSSFREPVEVQKIQMPEIKDVGYPNTTQNMGNGVNKEIPQADQDMASRVASLLKYRNRGGVPALPGDWNHQWRG
ncbi:hypothetical protein F4804DRAFT_336425 [Jackrogersella minutella]|nr:hypothetical protein F4804DRAFT_336425 [Jackrogersella minutella]